MARQRAIGSKPIVQRRAVAEGELQLSSRTARAIRAGSVRKGDPVAAGELAGMLAMKRTPELIPHCHVVPLTYSRVEIRPGPGRVRAVAEARSRGQTGVEMEALVGASVALLTVWDMVKYLEKDARGLYPRTALGPVRVRTKEKGGRTSRRSHQRPNPPRAPDDTIWAASASSASGSSPCPTRIARRTILRGSSPVR